MQAALLASFATAGVMGGIGVGCGTFESASDETRDAGGGEEGATEGGGGSTDGGEAGPEASTAHAFQVIYARGYGQSTIDAGGPVTMVPGAMLVDPSGGLVLGGGYSGGPVDVGDFSLAAPIGGSDAFLVKLDGKGSRTASATFGDSTDQTVGALAGTSAEFTTSLLFQGPLAFPGKNVLYSDAIPPALNSDVVGFTGAFTYVDDVGMRGAQNVLVKHLAVGPSGSAIAFGMWQNTIAVAGQFGGSAQAHDPSGTGLVVARQFGTSGSAKAVVALCPDGASCVAGGMATSPSGDTLIGGRFHGTLPAPDGGAPLTTQGVDENAYLIALDSALVPRWSLALGGSGTQEVHGIAAVPGTTDFVVVGSFDTSLALPGQAIPAPSANADVFILRITGAGVIAWVKVYGGPGSDVPRAVAVDAKANIFVVGDFTAPSLTLGGDVLKNADTGNATRDVFLGWFDGAGTPVYSARFGSAGDESAVAVGTDGSGDVFIAGAFDGGIDFGDGPLALKARGKTDTFIARLGPR